MMPAMSLDDCSGPNLKCWIVNCRFSSITQKGLSIHLRTVHGIEYREKARALKGARSRRKNAQPRDFAADPWSRAFACSICKDGYATKEELNRHYKQVHNCGAPYSPRAIIPTSSPGNPGCSGRSRGRAQTRPKTPCSYRKCQSEPQCNRTAVGLRYDQFYMNQMQVRADDFHEPARAMVQEPVPQEVQFDRSQMYDANRMTADWAGCRSSVQTPQAMSAEFASTIQNRGDENANCWIPQITAQRIDEGSMQLWSNVGQMQSFQYETRKDPINVSQGDSGGIQPCTQCGCASSGGCTQRADTAGDVNRIYLVEEDAGGTQNGAENHEIYHLQLREASDVKQVVSQGDVIVLECHTEDGHENQVVLKALQTAEPDSEEAIGRNDENDGLTLALASSPIDAQGMENEPDALEDDQHFNQDPTLAEDEPQSSEPIVQPAEESMQSALPQLFPELFEDCLVGSETKSVSWQSEETEESDNFFEVCKKSEYLAALSQCRGVKDDSGSLLLKCGRCSYCTDMGDPLEQLKIHIRKHMDKSFQCQKCEFECLLREEMLVHVGTQHDVAEAEPPY